MKLWNWYWNGVRDERPFQTLSFSLTLSVLVVVAFIYSLAFINYCVKGVWFG